MHPFMMCILRTAKLSALNWTLSLLLLRDANVLGSFLAVMKHFGKTILGEERA